MKRNIFIFMVGGFVLSGGAAAGATKCVSLNAAGSCTVMSDKGGIEWSGTCSYNGVETPVRGIWTCAKDSASNNVAQDSITVSSTASENVNCWVKMIYPAETRWVSAGSFSSYESCKRSCFDEGNWEYAMMMSIETRRTMFSNIIN